MGCIGTCDGTTCHILRSDGPFASMIYPLKYMKNWTLSRAVHSYVRLRNASNLGENPHFCPVIHHYPILSQHRMAMADTPLLDTRICVLSRVFFPLGPRLGMGNP